MKKWNENSALQVVHNDGFEVVGKLIKKAKTKGSTAGATGLTKLSAIDFLVNHCGYRF